MVELGATVSGRAVVGFGPRGGLAAWKSTESSLELRLLAADGTPRGTRASVPVERQWEPKFVFAVDRGFVLLLVLWDWQRSQAQWFGLLVGHKGQPLGSAVDLALADMSIAVGRALDGRRIGLVARPAAIAPNREKLRGRWQTLTVGAAGRLMSSAAEVNVDDIANTTQDRWVPAVLDGRGGWIVLRNGVRQPDGLFAGQRLPAAGASLVGDDFTARVINTATPPPRGPGDLIREALPRPGLVREHHGKPVGGVTSLLVDGDPVGVDGLSVDPDVVWSGRYFLYPFAASSHRVDAAKAPRTARLLPIDCRP